jgi:uncharacterized membrane protein YedE/YeeE
MRKLLFALLSGALFGFGLVVSGMTQPAKVLGFLDIAALTDGHWDPSLAFVMGGAVAVTLIGFAVTPRPGRRPWAAPVFALPSREQIDAPLLAGAALFGIGWGLAGYCPGPALAVLLTGQRDGLIFATAMLVGMAATALVLRRTGSKQAD